MVDIGQLILVLALSCAAYAIIASVQGARIKRDDLVKSGQNAAFAVTALLTLAVIVLWQQILAHDFHNEYVASYSNRDMPTLYILASLWGGQKGSLLFWGWLLSIYAALAIYLNRDKNRELMPYVVATLMVSAVFFMLLNIFVSPPFEKLWALADGRVIKSVTQPVGSSSFAPPDGRGLNPLLQHPAMAIHPPILYLGFVGFVVPFAFVIAALFTRRLDSQWLRTIRRWTIVPWFFLGIGLLLGGKWAYMELGWGGYWAWDPVENAALMPWLAGTAFIHSVMIQEKKNMLRVWNISLILLTYTLCIFGTFLTRSGVVSSVHSFARSDIAGWFVGYLVLLIGGSAILVIKRLPDLKTKHHFDSIVSRESVFLLNNLVFLGALFAVFWGTIFPIVTEAIRGEKITVAAPFFNMVTIPIGLFLLFLTGVGPLVAWRKTSKKLLKKIFLKPSLSALIGLIIMLVAGIRHFYALVSLTLSIFVVATIVAEFHRGARARMRTNDENYFSALLRLLQKNKRRYGGYVVHFGMVVMFVGFTGKAFDTEKEQHLQIGESMQVRGYTLEYMDFQILDDANKTVYKAKMDVYKNGKKIKTFYPNKHFYKVQEQPTTEVVLRSTLLEDLYVVLAQPNEDRSAVFKVYINPLVNLVWLSGLIITLGTFIILLPDAREKRMVPARVRTRRKAQVV
ncbi:MAG: heme lyase CcmF/NrfE family subunit [Calditrichaeota bacterium]|nr:heme lyase CcmF/NrfE family subunit [Calditrichota bacterium]